MYSSSNGSLTDPKLSASFDGEGRMRRAFWIMAGGIALALASAASAMAAESNDCPNGGTVRLGVEPYDTAARLVPIYKKVGKLIGEKLGCKVEVFVATSYNAEIEAMRN